MHVLAWELENSRVSCWMEGARWEEGGWMQHPRAQMVRTDSYAVSLLVGRRDSDVE